MNPRSRDMICPSFAFRFALLKQRAQGMPGARCTRGLVCKSVERYAHEHTGSAEALRHSLRDGLRLIRALPGETRLACHRLRKDAFASCEETPTIGASGLHDFTVRYLPRSSVVTSASTASHRAFVTCARPSIGWDGRIYTLICTSDKAKYLCCEGLCRRANQCHGQHLRTPASFIASKL
jgi:hypothetical protein